MTVASRAVMMAVMTEARMMGMIDVEQEGHISHWLWVGQEVAPGSSMVAPGCSVAVEALDSTVDHQLY